MTVSEWWIARRRINSMVSSSVRIFGWARLSGTVSSLIAPPFQRIRRSARRLASSVVMVTMTSSSRVWRSCLRSLSVVLGAAQIPSRSSPRAENHGPFAGAQRRRAAFLPPGEFRLGGPRLEGLSQAASSPRATSRLSGSTAP